MANVIKLRKGLDINLQGKAEEKKIQLKSNGKYALVPDDFEGVTPKVVVKEGDKVKAGDALFVNKQYPEVKFASPVSGTVREVVRGERRKVLCIKVDADAQQESLDFGKKDVSSLNGEQVINALLEAGIFGYINQLPYAVSTNPSVQPKAIFVSALRDKPLAADFEYEVQGQEAGLRDGYPGAVENRQDVSRTWYSARLPDGHPPAGYRQVCGAEHLRRSLSCG